MIQYAGTEKRRSPRVEDGIKIRIFDKQIRRLVSVLDMSRHGACLRTTSLLKTDEIINFAMYLPNEDAIIDLRARIVRVNDICSMWGFHKFDVGIEFLNTKEIKKESISKTVDYLMQKNHFRRI